jgi:hypothetical protein
VIRKRLDHISATHAGDYYQAVFDGVGEGDDNDYLLVQRQFEFPDGGRCYVETPDVHVCGHFRVRSARLSRNCFMLTLPDTSWEGFEVSFETNDASYARLVRILRTMFGRRLTVEK